MHSSTIIWGLLEVSYGIYHRIFMEFVWFDIVLYRFIIWRNAVEQGAVLVDLYHAGLGLRVHHNMGNSRP